MSKPGDFTVLVVDHDESVRGRLVAYLQGCNYATMEADTGLRGLQLFRRRYPDLVVADLRMPDVDGFEILTTVVKESPATPVIIVSGVDSIEDATNAMKLGAWDFIAKPLDDMQVLEKAVNRSMERAVDMRLDSRYRRFLEYEVKRRTSELEQRTRELEKAYRDLKNEVEGRREAEHTIDKERAFLQTLIDGVIDPVKVVDLEYRVVMMNRAARSSQPDDHAEMVGCHCHMVAYQRDTPCSGNEFSCVMDRVRLTGEPVREIHRHTLEGGQERTYELEASPLWNEDGSFRGIIEVTRDITKRHDAETRLREHESRLRHVTHHDPLTSLPNRLLFYDRLQRMMVKAQRSGKKVAAMFFSLDRFKKINETLGHDKGDQVLIRVARRIEQSVRKSDTVARLSGDEYAVILDDVKDVKSVVIITQKIMDRIGEQIRINDYELYLTASVGISLFPDDSQDVEGLMKCTDTAMNRAKEKGRDNYQFYTTDMNTRAFELLLMESGLRKALENEELLLYYQPQFDLGDRSLIGMEALLRWQDPVRGMVSPGDFIPLAEETGLIEPIGEWVLRTACRQNKSWQEAGLPPVPVAVNLSARQFRQKNLPAIVNGILAETGLAPDYLELELTESMIMQEPEEAIAMLQELSDMGIRLAIDDFGVGYSSLSYLKMFPIQTLKIDRSFVMNLASDNNDAMIAASIIALAHSMNLRVTAEGVETEQQLQFLRKQGCDSMQGFLLGRPSPVHQFVQYFAANNGKRL